MPDRLTVRETTTSPLQKYVTSTCELKAFLFGANYRLLKNTIHTHTKWKDRKLTSLCSNVLGVQQSITSLQTKFVGAEATAAATGETKGERKKEWDMRERERERNREKEQGGGVMHWVIETRWNVTDRLREAPRLSRRSVTSTETNSFLCLSHRQFDVSVVTWPHSGVEGKWEGRGVLTEGGGKERGEEAWVSMVTGILHHNDFNRSSLAHTHRFLTYIKELVKDKLRADRL